MVLNYCNILMQEIVISDVWSDCIPCVCVCFVCAHACICVILTPLLIGMCKVSSLLLICSVFCIQGFACSPCTANICLARIITCNPAYTSIIKFITFVLSVGWGSIVSTATGYGVDDLGFDSRWGRDFPHLSRLALRLTSLLYNGYRVFPGGKEAGAWHWPPTPSRAEVIERVELFIRFQSWPLWPVVGWPLPLPLCCFSFFMYCSFSRIFWNV